MGDVVKVNRELLDLLTSDEYIPVVAPIGTDKNGQSYNINADTVASVIACALKAEKADAFDRYRRREGRRREYYF